MQKKILLTGVTGYVGSELLGGLLERGYEVRGMARNADRARAKVPADIEIVSADVFDESSLQKACSGIDTAFYLIHSMGEDDFLEKELQGAKNFSAAAKLAGLKRIVYLGGLVDDSEELSDHMKSRIGVGKVLRESGVTVIELRASIVLGKGSTSYDMIRALTEKLPIMIMPKWVEVEAQPIGIDDLISYLLEAIELPADGSGIFEIGGSQRISYRGLMEEYARQRGLKRVMIKVPVLTPRLSSLWLALVTPVFYKVGRELIDSIKHPSIVNDNSALSLFQVKPGSASDAIANALRVSD